MAIFSQPCIQEREFGVSRPAASLPTPDAFQRWGFLISPSSGCTRMIGRPHRQGSSNNNVKAVDLILHCARSQAGSHRPPGFTSQFGPRSVSWECFSGPHPQWQTGREHRARSNPLSTTIDRLDRCPSECRPSHQLLDSASCFSRCSCVPPHLSGISSSNIFLTLLSPSIGDLADDREDRFLHRAEPALVLSDAQSNERLVCFRQTTAVAKKVFGRSKRAFA